MRIILVDTALSRHAVRRGPRVSPGLKLGLVLMMGLFSMAYGYTQDAGKDPAAGSAEISPQPQQDVALWIERAYEYTEKGDFDNALIYYNKAINLFPGFAPLYLDRGDVYAAEEYYDQAIVDYTKAIDIYPRFAEAYLSRGLSYGKEGKLDNALSDCNTAIGINPRFAEAYAVRGAVYCSLRDYDKAWEDVHKAESLGYTISADFLKMLKDASGRDR